MIQRHKWWFIGGAVLLLIFLFLRSQSSLPSSSAGSGNIQLPNTQDIWAEHGLADAIANLNAIWHPINDNGNVPGPTGTLPTSDPTSNLIVTQGIITGSSPNPNSGGTPINRPWFDPGPVGVK